MLYREARVLLDELAEGAVDGTRGEFMETLTIVPPLLSPAVADAATGTSRRMLSKLLASLPRTAACKVAGSAGETAEHSP